MGAFILHKTISVTMLFILKHLFATLWSYCTLSRNLQGKTVMSHRFSVTQKLVVLINTWGKSTSKMPSSNMLKERLGRTITIFLRWQCQKHKRYTLRRADSFFLFVLQTVWQATPLKYFSLSLISTLHQSCKYKQICGNMSLRYPVTVWQRQVTHKYYRKDFEKRKKKIHLVDWQTILQYSGPVLGVCNIGWIVTNVMQCGSTSRHVCDK